MSDTPNVVSRRNMLRGFSVVSIAALAKGCVNLGLPNVNNGNGGPNGGGLDDLTEAEAAAGNPDCIVTTEATEGPFYVNLNRVRSDIRETQSGSTLSLTFNVVEADTCTPIPDAVIDIWHAGAEGRYSAEASEGTAGETFLRGVQTTDAGGIARFTTIYPGWYAGRTVHMHGKVHIDNSVVTMQFFFADAQTDAVYAANAVYNTRGERGTRNEDDGILAGANEGVGVFMKITDNGDGTYAGEITIGVA